MGQLLRAYKVLALPPQGVPDSIYFLLNNDSAELFVTTITGQFVPISDSNSLNTISKENKQSTTIIKGSLVCISANGIVLATANGSNRSCVGITIEDVLPGHAGDIQLSGAVTVQGLVPNARYYLSTIDGQLSQTVADISGNIHQFIGIALDETTLELNLSQPILL